MKLKSILIVPLIMIVLFSTACANNPNQTSADNLSEVVAIANISEMAETLTEDNMPEFDETSNGNANFRNAMWGMTVDKVMATEASELLLQQQDSLMYYINVEPIPGIVVYTFENNKLITASLSFSFDNFYLGGIYNFQIPSDYDYYAKYSDIVEEMTKIYGEPKDFNENSISERTPYATDWETKNTKLSVFVDYHNNDYTIIVYVFLSLIKHLIILESAPDDGSLRTFSDVV